MIYGIKSNTVTSTELGFFSKFTVFLQLRKIFVDKPSPLKFTEIFLG